jgi:putative DNA primase/helicase
VSGDDELDVDARDKRDAARHAAVFPGATTTRIWDLVLDPADPYASALTILRERYTNRLGITTLVFFDGQFRLWDGASYAPISETDLRAVIYEMTADAVLPARDGKDGPRFKPSSRKVSDIIDAMKAATLVSVAVPVPHWRDGTADREASSVLACTNCLVHVPSRDELTHTPAFFNLSAAGCAYEPAAPPPHEWLAFLKSSFVKDDCIEALQEYFGYLQLRDTRQQKIMLIVGPPRSGKGTIARVLTGMLGSDNVVSPTLAALGSQFGLAPLIGKKLAVIADARLGGQADQQEIAERLLSISGEDSLTIDRKYLPAWTGRLSIRFIIFANELPKIADASGALASRFIIVPLTESFLGREDPGLTDKLLRELPSILNWSLAGLDRLNVRGYFLQPESAADSVLELGDLGSPIKAFVRDECTVASGENVEIETLFEAWCKWCKRQGRSAAGNSATFGRNLRAAVPGIKSSQPREAGGRVRRYEGIGLHG